VRSEENTMARYSISYLLDDQTTEGFPAEDASTESGLAAIHDHIDSALDLTPVSITITREDS